MFYEGSPDRQRFLERVEKMNPTETDRGHKDCLFIGHANVKGDLESVARELKLKRPNNDELKEKWKRVHFNSAGSKLDYESHRVFRNVAGVSPKFR